MFSAVHIFTRKSITIQIPLLIFLKGWGYRNGNPFSEGENIVLGKTDPFHEGWNCAWSNGYLFAEAANRPRGHGYAPGPRYRYAPYTGCLFPKSITQLGEPYPNQP